MIRNIIPGKTLYENPEELLNEIIKSIQEVNEKLEKLTVITNNNSIGTAAKFVALSKVLNLSTDDLLDFINETEKAEAELRKKITNENDKSDIQD